MNLSDSKDKQSVPKFSSFKPPPPASDGRAHSVHRHRSTREPESDRSKHSSHRDRSESIRRSDRADREKYHERSYSSRRHRHEPSDRRHQSTTHSQSSEHRSSSLNLRPTGTIQASKPSLESSTQTGQYERSEQQAAPSLTLPFFIDLKADEGIRKYGISNKWDIPNYRRSGGGYVLGMGLTHKIDRDQSMGDYVVLRPAAQADSSRKMVSKTPLSEVSKLPPPEFRIALKGHSQLDSNADYVSFDTDDWDPETETDRERAEAIDLDAERKARSAILWKAVQDSPEDVGAWLRLLDHQDMLILGPRDESHSLTRDERHSLADVKLSLCEKALGKIGESPHRDRLLLERLQTGAQLWSSQKLSEQWKATLHKNPQFINLWVKYLDFSQTDSPDFTFQHCLATHKECLRIVASASLADSSVQTYVFIRLTILYREAGYYEIAIGLWQAVLEFCCLKPASIDSVDVALGLFREFWETESPRIGEEGAKGWNSEQKPDVDPIKTEYSTQLDSSSILQSWTEAERERMGKCRNPARSLDGSDSKIDDPYRVVLFSDLAEILPLFGGFTNSDELIDAFLYFSQLPHLASPSNLQSTRLWSGDNFLRNEFVEDNRFDIRCWQPPYVKQDDNSPFKEIEYPVDEQDECRPALPFSYPLQNYLHSTETFFADPTQWFYSFQWWGESCSVQLQPERREWAQRTLQLFIGRHPEDEELAEYSLAFEFTCNPVMAKKMAKRLLKDRSSMLRLWNALAMMEARTNNNEKAVQIWTTALATSFKWKEPAKQIQRSILWQSWVWYYIEKGDDTAASYILHSIADEKIDPAKIPQVGQQPPVFSPTDTVRVQRLLSASQEDALFLRNPHAYVASSDCIALIYYLMGWPFNTAADIYDNAVSKLKQLPSELEDFKAFTAELLHQARARLFYRHMHRDPHMRTWKPVEFRDRLRESITLFPHNTMFSTLCMWNESRMLRIDRLRNLESFTTQDSNQRYQIDHMVSTALLPQTIAISTYLLPIWAEISTRGNNSGEYWVVRPLFEKALGEVLNPTDFRAGDAAVRARFGENSARSNLTIWKLYILYELYRVKDLAAAKSVFFRAIQACPWSKELIIFAFEHLRGDMPDLSGAMVGKVEGLSVEELRRLFLVLEERQLRLHLNIKDELVSQAAEGLQADEEMEDAPAMET
ncbi:hypothetical protein N7478_008120 [Penicillium angulare]|uniref:uncharacterized protein n=1 Tax=Penicillium angulare TaxID=116970 RepID=UPI00253FE8B0|nr:uncharacterized protein N7478_008120 [Penicillium angulare]KAJ5272995.1 hypothetical protein N7478_008120 [Penicillium angulare]